jgi:hypothetical protein
MIYDQKMKYVLLLVSILRLLEELVNVYDIYKELRYKSLSDTRRSYQDFICYRAGIKWMQIKLDQRF